MKRIRIYIRLLVSFTAVVFFLSCSEDVSGSGQLHGSPICFLFTASDPVEYVTRSDVLPYSQSAELRSSAGESLFVQATVSPGIDIPCLSSPFCSEDPFLGGYQTRGSQTTAFSTTQTITVDAIDHSGAFSSSTTKVSSGQSFNQAFTPSSSSSSLDISVSGKYWPYNQSGSGLGDRRLSFFAYYPTSAGTLTDSGTGYPTLSYTASTTLSSQTDLLVAKETDKTQSNLNGSGKLPVTFNHALSAVVFKIASGFCLSSGTLTISIKGVNTSGTYNFSNGTWTSSATGNYSLPAYTVTSSAASVSTLSSNAMFLIPQTIPSAATLEISYSDGHVTHVFSKTLKDISSITSWQPGHTYEYTVSSSAAVSGMTVTYPSGWPTAVGSSYAQNESFGLFAVDPVRNVIVMDNLEVKAATAASNPSLTLPSGYYYSSKYDYYLYCPYKSSLTGKPTNTEAAAVAALTGSPTDLQKADEFFKNVISNWTPSTDQSGGIKSSDLQVAKYSSGFAMSHRMGLVKLTMGTAAANTIPATRTYDGNTADSKYISSNYGSALTSQASFDGFTPFTVSSTYYHVVKSGTSTTLGSKCKVTTTKSGQSPVYQWSVTETPTRGQYLERSPAPVFRSFARLYAYTGSQQVYTPPIASKKYLLECWGPSGGMGSYLTDTRYTPVPGKGGYTYATITLSNLNPLYVYVGSREKCFNGGGSGSPNGGDASHIATVTGKLPTLESQKDKVLIVAGGAGGASDNYTSGHGGGENGGTGTTQNAGENLHYAYPGGGGSNSGGSAGYYGYTTVDYGAAGTFGQGGSGWGKRIVWSSGATADGSDPGGAGGGGWYGGGGVGCAGGGGGGSGHVKSGLSGNTIAGNQQVPNPTVHSTYSSGPYENVANYATNCPYASPLGHAGDGYVRITCTPYD